jgi:hypothetical protein
MIRYLLLYLASIACSYLIYYYEHGITTSSGNDSIYLSITYLSIILINPTQTYIALLSHLLIIIAIVMIQSPIIASQTSIMLMDSIVSIQFIYEPTQLLMAMLESLFLKIYSFFFKEIDHFIEQLEDLLLF